MCFSSVCCLLNCRTAWRRLLQIPAARLRDSPTAGPSTTASAGSSYIPRPCRTPLPKHHLMYPSASSWHMLSSLAICTVSKLSIIGAFIFCGACRNTLQACCIKDLPRATHLRTTRGINARQTPLRIGQILPGNLRDKNLAWYALVMCHPAHLLLLRRDGLV